jgi:hypothetical protein
MLHYQPAANEDMKVQEMIMDEVTKLMQLILCLQLLQFMKN